MEREWRYRGRTITASEMGLLRELIATHPQASRYELSRREFSASMRETW